MRDHLPPGLPPDPFADDPNDPSAALDELEPGQPLDPQERAAVEADLADLAIYEALLAHRGIRGLVVCCDDCQQDHYSAGEAGYQLGREDLPTPPRAPSNVFCAGVRRNKAVQRSH